MVLPQCWQNRFTAIMLPKRYSVNLSRPRVHVTSRAYGWTRREPFRVQMEQLHSTTFHRSDGTCLVGKRGGESVQVKRTTPQ